jgi:hypothetical protein
MTSFALSANAGVITMSFLTCKSTQTDAELNLTIDPSISFITYRIKGGVFGEGDAVVVYSNTLTRGGYLFDDRAHHLRGAILLGGPNGDVGATVDLEGDAGQRDSFVCSVEKQTHTHKPRCPHGVCQSQTEPIEGPTPIFHGHRHN